jgi:uncharacterized membrane protein HdeD (DUF308 family)
MREFWWFGPHTMFEGEPDSTAGYPWWAVLLFALSSIALGFALVIWPALLSVLVASTLLAVGAVVLPAAIAAAWHAWKHRPRRIRVRSARSHR